MVVASKESHSLLVLCWTCFAGWANVKGFSRVNAYHYSYWCLYGMEQTCTSIACIPDLAHPLKVFLVKCDIFFPISYMSSQLIGLLVLINWFCICFCYCGDLMLCTCCPSRWNILWSCGTMDITVVCLYCLHCLAKHKTTIICLAYYLLFT